MASVEGSALYRHVTLIDASDDEITHLMNDSVSRGEELVAHQFSTVLIMGGLIGERVQVTHSFIWKSVS
jgi:hypothetical protein